MARALVLGAGFGGIATAVSLRRQLGDEHEVMLVDRRDDFAMGLRKIWAILGISPIAYGTRSLASLRQQGITVVQGTVERIDPVARVAMIDGAACEADALVVALGAAQDMDAIPGLATYGLNAWDRTGIDHVHGVVDQFRAGRAVVGIFGAPYSCPPAPFELALLLSERFEARGIDARLTVFTPAPILLPILGVEASLPIDARLEDRGIDALVGRSAVEVTARAIRFSDGSELPYDLLLAVPPHRCPTVVVEAGLARPGGWVEVDRETLETGHPGVYALGDATAIVLANGLPLPKAGLFAEVEGEVIAARIAATFRGETPTATFTGRGACFIELGNGEASMVGGDFFADPPTVTLGVPSAQQRAAKEQFEMERLARWFGG
jgi:sulfide:quinone oxidoreductase